jgi:hypothetical protein
MNAHAEIRPERAQYEPLVDRFLPGCSGEELALRCSLLLLRDNATQGLNHCSDEAHDPLRAVERLASRYAYASVPLEQLKLLRYELVRLVTVATGLEQFAKAMGEQHARG